MLSRPAFALLLALLVSACAPSGISVPDTTDVPVGPVVVNAGAHENLHAVLWTQTAAEYRAIALQTYAAARAALDAALADTSWTADPAQRGMSGYGALPPAVVLDVDETVLDNAVYQARLIETGRSYSSETWKAWVEEEAAPPVPGALAFTRAADSLGIAVVYLTNRNADEEAATRRNLEAEGFPLRTDFDAVLTRGEIGGGGEKGLRRAAVAEQFRVLELLGDNLGDFLSDVEGTVEARDRLAAPYAGWWGTRWFMLPNPQYGSWESALYKPDGRGPTREDQLRQKVERLDTGNE